MKLSDCGKVVNVVDDITGKTHKATVIMTIKSPRGICRIYDTEYYNVTDHKCQAIRAFMEQHYGE